MNIELCIPAIKAGAHCLEFYIDNLIQTAARPDRIKISVSYHNEEDLKWLSGIRNANRIMSFFHAPSYKEGKFVASANHSSAINILAEYAHGDIVIFSDYDMAFLRRGWDEDIERVLRSHDFFGTPYAPLELGFSKDPTGGAAPWLAMNKLMKYQNTPNLGFFAIKKTSLDRILKDGPLTQFDKFLNNGGLPFRFVNTKEMAEELNLSLGALNWMDTGYEITGFEKKYGFTHRSLEYIKIAESEVFTHKFLLAQVKQIFHPEIFHFDSVPFLFHFKKGTMKAELGGDFNFFDYFKLDVNNYLAKS